MGDEHWDAVGTAARIRARDVTAVEVVEAAVRRAEAATELGALLATSFDGALEAAARVDAVGADRARVFHGVPTVVKDLEDVAGLPAGMGSRAFAGRVPSRTARSVEQFLSTGAISLGKSSTPEWGMTATTEPLAHAPTCNPWDHGRTAGGSSGGAGALVAAGVVPVAYATDGGGSIRIPASACGLVGLKPSRGRLEPLSRSENLPIKVTTYGAIATSVRDVAAFHAAVEDVAPAVGLPRIGHVLEPSRRRLRVGVVRDTPTGRVIDPEVLAGVDATAAVLDDLGHVTVEMANPFDQELVDDFTLFWGFLAYGIRRVVGPQMMGRSFDPSQLEPWTLALGEHFRRNAWRFPASLRRLRGVARTYAEAYAPYDVVLQPTNGTRPPVLGHLSVELPFEEHRERVERWVPFTPAQNLSGAPGISLPLWRTADGLPIGMHLSSVLGDERTLLELSLELEDAMPWPRWTGDVTR